MTELKVNKFWLTLSGTPGIGKTQTMKELVPRINKWCQDNSTKKSVFVVTTMEEDVSKWLEPDMFSDNKSVFERALLRGDAGDRLKLQMAVLMSELQKFEDLDEGIQSCVDTLGQHSMWKEVVDLYVIIVSERIPMEAPHVFMKSLTEMPDPQNSEHMYNYKMLSNIYKASFDHKIDIGKFIGYHTIFGDEKDPEEAVCASIIGILTRNRPAEGGYYSPELLERLAVNTTLLFKDTKTRYANVGYVNTYHKVEEKTIQKTTTMICDQIMQGFVPVFTRWKEGAFFRERMVAVGRLAAQMKM